MAIVMEKKLFFYFMKSIIQYSWSWQYQCETHQDLLLSHFFFSLCCAVEAAELNLKPLQTYQIITAF